MHYSFINTINTEIDDAIVMIYRKALFLCQHQLIFVFLFDHDILCWQKDRFVRASVVPLQLVTGHIVMCSYPKLGWSPSPIACALLPRYAAPSARAEPLLLGAGLLLPAT